LIKKDVDFEEAVQTCEKEMKSGTLAVINSEEEQKFIENYMFSNIGVVKYIWIGFDKYILNGSLTQVR
jgi:hypothetical protein